MGRKVELRGQVQAMTQIINSLEQIGSQYRALFCDLWGVLHNGRDYFPAAAAALQAFRRGGGRVVLLTNAPRPHPAVQRQMEALGVPRDAYDLIVTSGDASQAAIAAGLYGKKVFHIGSGQHEIFFENHDGAALPVTRVGLDEADSIVCTGLFDDFNETPDDYRQIIAEGVNKGLTMLCANPDLVVDHGETRIYCAGSLGAAYTAAGGTTHYYGKPHAPIYELARTLLARDFGLDVPPEDTLAVGDGIVTDVPGAMADGCDCLFVVGGLAADEIGIRDGNPDADRLAAFLTAAQMNARYAIGYLR